MELCLVCWGMSCSHQHNTSHLAWVDASLVCLISVPLFIIWMSEWLWKEGLRMFYTSAAPYIFMVWCLIRHWDNMYFYFYFLVLYNLISFAVNDGQTPAPQYRGLRNAMATIFRQEGARGLYRGVTPNVWGSGSAWGFYFLLYVPSTKFFLFRVPSVTLP